jgi:type IV pilus assembly protein PilM
MATSKKHFFIPAPRFLSLHAAGVDIAERAVRMIDFAKGTGGLSVKVFDEVPLPAGAIVNGSIEKPEEVTRALQQLSSKHALSFASVSLPEEKVYLFKTELPPETVDVRAGVEFKLEENVPLSLSEALFDWLKIERDREHPSDHLDINVSVVSRLTAELYGETLKSAGILPIAFVSETRALARALLAPDESGTVMLVHIKAAGTTLAIVSEGVVRFTSTLPIGTDAILGAIEKQYSVKREEALAIAEKRLFSETKESVELFFSLINTLSALKDEIVRFAEYWRSRSDMNGDTTSPVKRLVLSGSFALMTGFTDYLESSTGLPASVGNVWRNVMDTGIAVPPIPKRQSLDYAAAIGLALS